MHSTKEIKKAYFCYEIYDCPTNPSESGSYVGSTPLLDQAIAVASHGNRLIKGVTADGQKVLFL